MIWLWVMIRLWMIRFRVMIGFWVIWLRFMMVWGRMVGFLVVGNMMMIRLVVIRFRMMYRLRIMGDRITIRCRCRMHRSMSIWFRVPVRSRMVNRCRSIGIMMTI